MKARAEYNLVIRINSHEIRRVIIDQHYKINHPDVTDEIILDLVKSLDGEDFPVQAERGEYQYFATEPVFRDQAPYRIVMVLCIFDDFLGVINAFRVDRRQNEQK
jgi:hypothetical protein